MIKRILLLCLISWSIAQAGIQGNTIIPDRIVINNTSQHLLSIQNKLIKPGAQYTYTPDHDSSENSFTIRCANRKYRVSYPTYNQNEPVTEVFSIATLDFNTMLCVAGDYQTISNATGLDEICLKNDTLYTIAAIVKLNEDRSNPRRINPNESIAKVIRDQEKAALLIADENHIFYSLSFPCHRSKRTNNDSWSSITLSAGTIKWFNCGFKITIA